MQRSKKKIISSSGGVSASGQPVITPVSVITYVEEDGSRVFKSRAADDVCFLMNPLWTHQILNVSLPVARIFEHVPLDHALIRHWINPHSRKMGGLLFPRLPFDTESLVPSIQILKSAVVGIGLPPPALLKDTIQADLTLSVFRRELQPSVELQPFDSAVWHPIAYGVWHYFHSEFAPMFEEECDAAHTSRLPGGACALFRRMMHTHYADCGLIFGSMWWKFGLGDMVGDDMHDFMRGMLVDMYMAYNVAPTPPALPPLFNAVTLGSGQRVCAGCMTFRLGTGQMKRCPCQQVYYCSKACQNANWTVHRAVCGRKKKPAQ
jgi:hypothetical protein